MKCVYPDARVLLLASLKAATTRADEVSGARFLRHARSKKPKPTSKEAQAQEAQDHRNCDGFGLPPCHWLKLYVNEICTPAQPPTAIGKPSSQCDAIGKHFSLAPEMPFHMHGWLDADHFVRLQHSGGTRESSRPPQAAFGPTASVTHPGSRASKWISTTHEERPQNCRVPDILDSVVRLVL
jgi:hypothetical protein